MKITDLLPQVMPDVPGCPRATVVERLIQAARQFARDSLVWDVELDRLQVTAEQTSVDLFAPTDGEVEVITSAEIDEESVAHRWDGETLTLPERHRAGLLIVRAALQPLLTATQLPAPLARWPEPIIDYARSRLLSMPRQEWTSLELGFAFRQQYEGRLTDARVERSRSRTNQPIRTKTHVSI
jgi:hypothetical protein